MNLLLEGTDLEALLLRAHQEGGTAAKIVRAEKVRRGGILGFFAREGFEVAVEIPEDGTPDGTDAVAPPAPAQPAPAQPAPAQPSGAAAPRSKDANDGGNGAPGSDAAAAGRVAADPLLGLADRVSAAERAASRALAAELAREVATDEARADAEAAAAQAQAIAEAAAAARFVADLVTDPAMVDEPVREVAPAEGVGRSQPRPWVPASLGLDLEDDVDADAGLPSPSGSRLESAAHLRSDGERTHGEHVDGEHVHGEAVFAADYAADHAAEHAADLDPRLDIRFAWGGVEAGERAPSTWRYAGRAVLEGADALDAGDPGAADSPEFTALVHELRDGGRHGRHRPDAPRHRTDLMPGGDPALGNFLPTASHGTLVPEGDPGEPLDPDGPGEVEAQAWAAVLEAAGIRPPVEDLAGYVDEGDAAQEAPAGSPPAPQAPFVPGQSPAPASESLPPARDVAAPAVMGHEAAPAGRHQAMAASHAGSARNEVRAGEPAGEDGWQASAQPRPEHADPETEAFVGSIVTARATTILPAHRRSKPSMIPHPRHSGDHHTEHQGEEHGELPGPAVEASWRRLRNLRPSRRPAERGAAPLDDPLAGPEQLPDIDVHISAHTATDESAPPEGSIETGFGPSGLEPQPPSPEAYAVAIHAPQDYHALAASVHDALSVHDAPPGYHAPQGYQSPEGYLARPDQHAAPRPLPVEPDSGEARLAADRGVLESLGLPVDWSGRLTGGDRFTAVYGVLERMPEPDIDPHAPVVAVVGSAGVAELEAHRTALDLPVGSRPRAVVTVPAGGAEDRRAAVAAARQIRPVVVGVETDGYADPAKARKVLRSIQADVVIAVVDATRPISEAARWVEEFDRVDAIALDGALEVADPAAVMALDLPVVRMDGIPIDRFGWTALLCAHLVARED